MIKSTQDKPEWLLIAYKRDTRLIICYFMRSEYLILIEGVASNI